LSIILGVKAGAWIMASAHSSTWTIFEQKSTAIWKEVSRIRFCLHQKLSKSPN